MSTCDPCPIEIVRWRGERKLVVPASTPELGGQVVDIEGQLRHVVPLTHVTAARVRELVPWARPTPFATEGSSFGFGDRLGLATRGHLLALQRSSVSLRPVLAQQSARELERTGRSFADVLDAATWAVLEAGWSRGFGADADHLTTSSDVTRALDAGFTMLTLDPSAHVDTTAALVSGADLEGRIRALPWQSLEDDWAAMRRRHRAATTKDGALALARAAATYGSALAHVATLSRGISHTAVGELDVEVSLDETGLPTSPHDHAFVVAELRRLGVPFTGLAVRFEGEWEKAVDVRGDIDAVRRSIEAHAAIAERLGPYKLSVHSGSDKPTVYPLLASVGGSWHVKTSGTSYLEALRVVARHDPELFRRVAVVAADRMQRDRGSYTISATAALPDVRGLADAELPRLLVEPNSRQCLHVTYGAVLAEPQLGSRLRATLERFADEYAETLATHFASHLDPLAALA